MHEFPPATEDRWIDHMDALNFKIPQLKALAHAMACIAHCDFEFFLMNKEAHDPAGDEQILPLSFLSQRLCDEVAAHVEALNRYGRDSSEEKEGGNHA